MYEVHPTRIAAWKREAAANPVFDEKGVERQRRAAAGLRKFGPFRTMRFHCSIY
jgi:hypothetical protein